MIYRLDGQVGFEIGVADPLLFILVLSTLFLSIKLSTTPNFKFVLVLSTILRYYVPAWCKEGRKHQIQVKLDRPGGMSIGVVTEALSYCCLPAPAIHYDYFRYVLICLVESVGGRRVVKIRSM